VGFRGLEAVAVAENVAFKVQPELEEAEPVPRDPRVSKVFRDPEADPQGLRETRVLKVSRASKVHRDSRVFKAAAYRDLKETRETREIRASRGRSTLTSSPPPASSA
jgi:hypothetical protein